MEVEETDNDISHKAQVNGDKSEDLPSNTQVEMCSPGVTNGGENGEQGCSDVFDITEDSNTRVNGDIVNTENETGSQEFQYSNGVTESGQIIEFENLVGASMFDPGGGDIIIPSSSQNDMSDIATDPSQEVIAISDDEDEGGPGAPSQFPVSASFSRPPFLDQNDFLGCPGPSRPSSNMPLNFSLSPRRMPPAMSPMPMPPPPPLRQMFPRGYGMPGPSDVITLSDDDDENHPALEPSSRKRKRSSRKKGTMFHPQICPYCYKQKRENICMSKHLIRHHWTRIRAQNMGNTKVTDYANLKDDREIPVEKYKEERPRYRPHSPPLSRYSPSMSRSGIIEQPLRPSIGGHVRGAFGRPPALSSPSFSSAINHDFGGPGSRNSTITSGASSSFTQKEPKSLGQEVAEELGHPSNRKLVQNQLSLLMHAHKCNARGSYRKQNSLLQEEKTCALPNCAATKELLQHLPSCTAETECPVAKCFMSKQIIKWALSSAAPGSLRESRSELARMAQSGLPREVVKLAARGGMERVQWRFWRETQASRPPLPSGVVENIPSGSASNTKTIPDATRDNGKTIPLDNSSKGQSSSIQIDSNNVAAGANNWKLKYLKASEKMKEVRQARHNKNGSVPKQVQVADRIVPSQASADIVSTLLNAQSEVLTFANARSQARMWSAPNPTGVIKCQN